VIFDSSPPKSFGDFRVPLVRVEAYAGASYPERPTAVWWEGRRLEVERVIRSWRTPDALHFWVELQTLGETTLSYHYQDDAWTCD